MSYEEWLADWSAGFQQRRAEAMELARTWVGCRVRVCLSLEAMVGVPPKEGVLEWIDEQGYMHIRVGSLPGGHPDSVCLGVGCAGKGVTLAQEPGAAEG